MSSSPLGTIEIYDVADFADNHPVGARAWRDGPVNSVLHCADQRAVVHCNWVSLTTPVEGQDNGIGAVGTSSSSWQPILIHHAPNVSLKTDGSPYRLRFRVVGASKGGASVSFRFVVSDFASMERFAFDPPAYAETFTGITSTTPAILTPDSGLNYIDVGREVADASLREYATLADLGGLSRTVQTCELWISLWSKWNSTTDEGICSGLYVAEFFAP